MALVFLFALASCLLMVKVMWAGATLGAALAMGCFLALAIGVFVGAFLQARRWEEDPT